jgi:hypothetical protein
MIQFDKGIVKADAQKVLSDVETDKKHRVSVRCVHDPIKRREQRKKVDREY